MNIIDLVLPEVCRKMKPSKHYATPEPENEQRFHEKFGYFLPFFKRITSKILLCNWMTSSNIKLCFTFLDDIACK